MVGTKPPPKGLCCPKCECRHVPVMQTRHGVKHTKRYRECRHCGHRFVTIEVMPSQVDPE